MLTFRYSQSTNEHVQVKMSFLDVLSRDAQDLYAKQQAFYGTGRFSKTQSTRIDSRHQLQTRQYDPNEFDAQNAFMENERPYPEFMNHASYLNHDQINKIASNDTIESQKLRQESIQPKRQMMVDQYTQAIILNSVMPTYKSTPLAVEKTPSSNGSQSTPMVIPHSATIGPSMRFFSPHESMDYSPQYSIEQLQRKPKDRNLLFIAAFENQQPK